MLSPARVAVQQVLQREQPSEGLAQGRGNQAKRRVVKILSDRHVRCRPKSACRVIQTNQLFGSTAQNVLLAGQLWYRRRSEVRGRSERRPFVHPWFLTTTMDVGALQTDLRDGFCFRRLARGGRRLERSQRFSLSLSNLDCPHLQRQPPADPGRLVAEKEKSDR